MRCLSFGVCLALLSLIACGGEEPSGPALEPRPEVQTCLSDLSAGMPQRLSETGCFQDLASFEPGPDLIPYEVNSALWTDGAFKPRFMVVPSPKRIRIEDGGAWTFPEGSILIKVFGFEFERGDPSSRRPVETRFMVLRDGVWEYTSYQWNEDGTDAERLDEAKTVEYSIQDGNAVSVIEYQYPDYDACITCHGGAINEVLGPKTAQLNREHDYGGVVANQLRAMASIDLLELDAGEDFDPAMEPRMANPRLGEGSLEERARAYLDANCAHCHRPGGWAPSDIGLDLRYEVTLEETGVCASMKYFGWAGRPRVLPGDPEGSGLVQRLTQEDALRMPSLGTSIIDPFGVGLLSDWIARLQTCP